MGRLTSARVVVAALGAAGLVLAAPGPARAERVLHERVIDPSVEEGPLVDQPAEGRNPAALRLPQREVEEPTGTAETREGETAQQASGMTPHDGAQYPSQEWRPDLQTARSTDMLAGHSSFNPSVTPHERLNVLDQVAADYTLRLSAPALRDVPVGGQPDEDRDLFWGSVVVRLAPDRPVPVPSVAPDSRILSVEARPAMPIRFFRDGADNFFAASPDPQAGQARLVFVTDAPASYFGGPLPGAALASDVPAGLRPVLPPNVASAAAGVARQLGLDTGAPIARNLARLVAYLRSFRPEPLDAPPGADPYVTLALGRRGVCRHRAFVFVVTAQGLGLPARFVTNAIHAFAEVYVPTTGWVAIDLGGEARLAPESEPVPRHEPRAPDPFPWPASSQVDESRLAGQGPSGPSGQGPTASGADASGGSGVGSGGAGAGVNPPRVTTPDRGAPGQVGDAGAGDAMALGEPGEASTPASEQPGPERRDRVVVALDRHAAHVVRGETLPITGRVDTADGPVPGARVSLSLRGPGGVVPLGHATCDDDGRFSARLGVPQTVATGDYVITATATPPSRGE
jgi:transglutaminase-like putative cysteine protease